MSRTKNFVRSMDSWISFFNILFYISLVAVWVLLAIVIFTLKDHERIVSIAVGAVVAAATGTVVNILAFNYSMLFLEYLRADVSGHVDTAAEIRFLRNQLSGEKTPAIGPPAHYQEPVIQYPGPENQKTHAAPKPPSKPKRAAANSLLPPTSS